MPVLVALLTQYGDEIMHTRRTARLGLEHGHPGSDTPTSPGDGTNACLGFLLMHIADTSTRDVAHH